MSKSRIAPLKEKEHLKIPKLELLGVLIGSRLMKYISKSLQVSISRRVLWTDSQIVLSWIKGNKLLSPFIARRIGEIKQNDAVEFRYVPSKENPADIGTRSNAACLSQSIWQSGPLFLNKDESEWPAQITTNNIFLAGEVPTLVGEQDVCNDDKNSNEDDNIQNIEPDCDEETSRIRDTQKHYFHQEYIGKTTNISRSLQLYKDNKGLVRCKGRFQNADCSIEQKFPILLPREAEFTHSIIKNIHETNYHVGVSHTLALLRKRFWVPKGRSTVQKVIKKCVQCQKYAGGPFKLPPMPPLPKERVTCCPAFSYTGTDYMGPLKISSGDKRWICVLTCLSVRAIHMEVVHNLTAEEFNLAIRRFIAVRGLPVLITSDNATQMKLMADVITSNHCIENKVKWRFIPELAPWYGGFYERLMSLIKQCMKRTLEKHLLNDQQLLTIVKEIEAVLNTRPLTYVGDEVEHVLSPIDFLCVGSPVVTKSSEEQILGRCTNTKEDLIQGWKRGQKIIQEFSKMFIGQYLPYLRQRNSFHKESRVVCNRVPKVGEMVQIKGDSSNRAHWKIGKITELIKSRDGNIRVVKVCTDNGHILNRSIAHLYPLELDNESIEDDKTSESLVNNRSSESIDTEIHKSPLKETTIPIDDGKSKPTEETQARPQRKAAIKARNLLKLLTKQLVARQ